MTTEKLDIQEVINVLTLHQDIISKLEVITIEADYLGFIGAIDKDIKGKLVKIHCRSHTVETDKFFRSNRSRATIRVSPNGNYRIVITFDKIYYVLHLNKSEAKDLLALNEDQFNKRLKE